MQIDLPLLDDLSETDVLWLKWSALQVAARVAKGEISGRDIAYRLTELFGDSPAVPMLQSESIEPIVDERFRQKPITAPEKYSARMKVAPDTFLLRVYGGWLKAGTLFQNDLRRLDLTLMKALDKQYNGRREALRQIVPTKYDEVTMNLVDRSVQRQLDVPNRSSPIRELRRPRQA